MPESKTYFPNGVKIGTALEVDTDAPAEINGGMIISTSLEVNTDTPAEINDGLIVNTSLVVNTDAPAEINDGLIVGTSLVVNTDAPAEINDGLIVDTSMAVDADDMSIGENAELTIGHDGTDGFVKTDNVDPSDLHIITGAGKTLVLDTAVWNDLPPTPVVGAKLGATAPTLATFVDDIQQFTFDNSDDFIIGNTEVVHGYKEGTDILPHVHWVTNGTDGTERTVKWQYKYTIANGKGSAPFDSLYPSQVVLNAEIVIPASTGDRAHIISGLGTIPGAGIQIGSVIAWRFERIASSGDEPSNDPFALQVGAHAQFDTLASRGLFTK